MTSVQRALYAKHLELRKFNYESRGDPFLFSFAGLLGQTSQVSELFCSEVRNIDPQLDADMGACSSKPKTTDYPNASHIDSEKKSLDYELQSEAGCKHSFESTGNIDSEQMATSEYCATQSVQLQAAIEGKAVGQTKKKQVSFKASEATACENVKSRESQTRDKPVTLVNGTLVHVTEDSNTNLIKLNNAPFKQVVELSKEHMVGYDKHFVAFRSSHSLEQGWHVLEPVKPICNKLEVITDMDQMLEKLASEFERQESLCSYSL
ncbi:hypothetical protein GOP47_0019560 [Adiantum capillus-veneris]|uniref:Uncharacterized protein n=1 Tax=Adiantum capillus-veneris TaxID=13818 RepID=A0A9D4UBJ0_ADICA|nr:hypothetical protein GOP47_0019560 [Adiantum capillus-veneris]